MARQFLESLLTLGLLALALPAKAAELTPDRQAAVAQCRLLSAAQLGSQHPLAAASLALIALDTKPPAPLDETPQGTPDQKAARPPNDPLVDPERLVGVEDFTEFPQPDNPEEYRSYLYLIDYARYVPAKELEKAARLNDNIITFMHVMNSPSSFRGTPMLIKGTLNRLLRFDAPPPLRGSGIRYIYEAWIIREDPESKDADARTMAYPCCVVFTELPDRAKLGENQKVPVEFAGYFFKRLHTDLKWQKKPADAPFFIARTIRPAGQAGVEVVGASSLQFLLMIVAALAILGVLAFVVHLWFRREDRVVQNRLHAVRTKGAGPGAAQEAAEADQEHDLTSFRFDESEPGPKTPSS